MRKRRCPTGARVGETLRITVVLDVHQEVALLMTTILGRTVASERRANRNDES